MEFEPYIKRMRELGIKWKDISYVFGVSVQAAYMATKRKRDIEELGEKSVIKKYKFDAGVLLKLKQLAHEDEKLLIRDLEGELAKLFPGKLIPSLGTIHNILNESGLQIMKLLRKTLIFPRNQLKRMEFCREMAEYGPAFWDTVIWSDETTVRQMPKGKNIEIPWIF